VGVSDVVGFDQAVFDKVVSHHFEELSAGGVAGHGLGFACSSGILDFALDEVLILLEHSLDYHHIIRGLHVNVRESIAHAVLFLVEDDVVMIQFPPVW
jgi:hypothetical protein